MKELSEGVSEWGKWVHEFAVHKKSVEVKSLTTAPACSSLTSCSLFGQQSHSPALQRLFNHIKHPVQLMNLQSQSKIIMSTEKRSGWGVDAHA